MNGEDHSVLRPPARLIHLAFLLYVASLPAQSIPPVHTASLAGNTVSLPDDLHGRTLILVLGFSRGSQDEVTAWGKRLAADYNDSAAIQYYELAMLASVPRPLRGFVIRSMKNSVPSHAQPHFLPLTTDEDAWRSLTRYKSGDSAYVLVIDSIGAVRWQTQGPATDAAIHELKRHLP
jgi:hypothetical protein